MTRVPSASICNQSLTLGFEMLERVIVYILKRDAIFADPHPSFASASGWVGKTLTEFN